MITTDEVEAACVGIHGRCWKIFDETRKEFFRSEQRRALEAAEAVRPGMVEVGVKAATSAQLRAWDIEWPKLAGMPVGTKLYAEQPK